MFFMQWEELCVVRGVLIHCIVQQVVTEGYVNRRHVFPKLPVKGWAKISPLCGLYPASRHESFRKIFT